MEMRDFRRVAIIDRHLPLKSGVQEGEGARFEGNCLAHEGFAIQSFDFIVYYV